MKTTNSTKKFEILSGRQQILERPQMWIGSMDSLVQNQFIISEDSIERREVDFIPAFNKIISEILDNSLDALIPFDVKNKRIAVKMTDDLVSIRDNGPGIPVVKKSVSEIKDKSLSEDDIKKISETYIPEIAWTRLFSGTNFNNEPDKVTIGSHGIGSKATAIFSTKFVGRTDDGKKACTVSAINNLESSTCKITKSSGITGTTVEFKPDFKRFKLDKIDQVYKDLIYQRLLCLSVTFPDISFSFNGKKINITSKRFVSLFSKDIVFQSFDRGFVAVFPNQEDEFNFFSYVNGLSLIRGGSHIDYIINQLTVPVRDKLVRKYKTIKPADIRNKMSLVVFLKDFPNAKYDSQTKETLTNAPSEVSNFIAKDIDFERMARIILRTPAIIDPIVETVALKETVKNRILLKNAIKNKVKISADKYISPTGPDQKNLLICEGWSAAGGLSQALGRNGNAFYASRGMPLNVVSAKMSAIVKNVEFHDIMAILGLDPQTPKVKQPINFDVIVHAGDSDLDASHILGIYMGWYIRFAPHLFEERKIARLMTPYVVLWADNKMTKIHKAFYNMQDFKEFEAKNDTSKYKKNLFKGLGSWSKEQFQKLFSSSPNGLDDFIQYISLDEAGKILTLSWLSSELADERKAHLRSYNLDIDRI